MNGKILIVSAHPDDWELGCGGTIERLKREGCEVSHCVLGKGRGNFMDNQFDKLTLINWVAVVEGLIEVDKPNIIFTHYANDLNIDHRITYQAVITAARPQPDCCVKEIYSFEVLSSTEWNFPNTFSPDAFVSLLQHDIEKKVRKLGKEHSSEMRDANHPRSYVGVWELARSRGRQAGVDYAEAFKTVRRII